MGISSDISEDIKNAIKVLKEGGVILYPTDTIWGIGCDATNKDAVSKIYAIKKRSDTKSMLVLLDSVDKLSNYIKQVPELSWDLVELTDKPLTIIYPHAKNLATNLLAHDGSIGIRVTRDLFCVQLLRLLGKPLVSTSANLSGKLAPSIFSNIEMDIREQVDYVVSYRQEDKTIVPPSGIISLGVDNSISIIRKQS